MKSRILFKTLDLKRIQKTGRLIVLTGARQTGKTTLVKKFEDEYTYLSLEDPVIRTEYKKLTADQWNISFPRAILDEVQKIPQLIESIKAVYDKYPESRYILLGSSQIMLLKQVKESLAGRVSIFELYPLTLPEAGTNSWNDTIISSKMIQYLSGDCCDPLIFNGNPLLDPQFHSKQINFDKYLEIGLMPTMTDEEIDIEEKKEWLKNYTLTYLQRDLRDLVNIRDLEPFIKAQKSAAFLTSQSVNYSSIANFSGISSNTARRFYSYMELSYQIFLLPPWFRNVNKRLSKSPKLHFIDPGILRTITGHTGMLNGHEFESAVASEIYKQIKSWRLPVNMYHLRTVDGLEVDILLECEKGFIPIEIKQTENIRTSDARHLERLKSIVDKPVIHSFVLSNDPEVKLLKKNITALPAAWFLG